MWRSGRKGQVVPADTGALDSNGHLARFETLTLFDAVEGRSGLCYPEIVLGVGEDADIGLADGVCDCCHRGSVLGT